MRFYAVPGQGSKHQDIRPIRWAAGKLTTIEKWSVLLLLSTSSATLDPALGRLGLEVFLLPVLPLTGRHDWPAKTILASGVVAGVDGGQTLRQRNAKVNKGQIPRARSTF